MKWLWFALYTFVPVFCFYLSGLAAMVRQIENKHTITLVLLDNGLFILGWCIYLHILKKAGIY